MKDFELRKIFRQNDDGKFTINEMVVRTDIIFTASESALRAMSLNDIDSVSGDAQTILDDPLLFAKMEAAVREVVAKHAIPKGVEIAVRAERWKFE
nr:hypothetical protein [uncultured Nitrososphaera sp.]